MSAITTAVSGMNAAVAKLNLTAASVAAVSGVANPTSGSSSSSSGAGSSGSATSLYSSLQLSSVPNGFDFTSAMSDQADSLIQFQANLKLVQAGNEMFKTLNNTGSTRVSA